MKETKYICDYCMVEIKISCNGFISISTNDVNDPDVSVQFSSSISGNSNKFVSFASKEFCCKECFTNYFFK